MAKPRSRYQFDREVLALYDRIKFDRADGRCECEGDCGRSHKFGIHRRCAHIHGRQEIGTGTKVVSLSVRHLDGDAKNYDDNNLLAMCQGCITRHRNKVKKQATKRAELESVKSMHEPMFDLAEFGELPTGNGLTL